MRKFLSYCKSHIYDIHSIIVAIILIVLIRCIKKMLRKKMFDKECNMLNREILLLIMLIVAAVLVFALLAMVSPFVDFSLQSGIMSGVYALCGNAFIEQIMPQSSKKDSE